MKNKLFRFINATEAMNAPFTDCLGSAPLLAHELAAQDQVKALVASATGSIALEHGVFTTNLEVPVPDIVLLNKKMVEDSGFGDVLFGIWEDTSQEPPVITPAQLQTSNKAFGMMADILAKATGSSEVAVTALPEL